MGRFSVFLAFSVNVPFLIFLPLPPAWLARGSKIKRAMDGLSKAAASECEFPFSPLFAPVSGTAKRETDRDPMPTEWGEVPRGSEEEEEEGEIPLLLLIAPIRSPTLLSARQEKEGEFYRPQPFSPLSKNLPKTLSFDQPPFH